jgi:predicted ABC-type ATPase
VVPAALLHTYLESRRARIDELDAIARSRQEFQMHSDEKACVNELLVQLDRVLSLGRLMVATTNFEVDPGRCRGSIPAGSRPVLRSGNRGVDFESFAPDVTDLSRSPALQALLPAGSDLSPPNGSRSSSFAALMSVTVARRLCRYDRTHRIPPQAQEVQTKKAERGLVMAVAMPSAIVLAGPNGAGKSTSAPSLLRDVLGVGEFVNADVIARGLSAFDPERAALAAGRVMLTRLRDLAQKRESFAFETTLASRSFAPWLAELKRTGYTCHLVFLWLPSVEAAMVRVADRVLAGGHDVPEATIRRRYEAGLNNFFALYQPLATSWRMYDNSCSIGPALIAAGEGTEERTVAAPATWDQIKARYAP